jgi:hypothetical protein
MCRNVERLYNCGSLAQSSPIRLRVCVQQPEAAVPGRDGLEAVDVRGAGGVQAAEYLPGQRAGVLQ